MWSRTPLQGNCLMLARSALSGDWIDTCLFEFEERRAVMLGARVVVGWSPTRMGLAGVLSEQGYTVRGATQHMCCEYRAPPYCPCWGRCTRASQKSSMPLTAEKKASNATGLVT